MDTTRTKIIKALTMAFLVLFPFGQLLRSQITLFSTSLTIHPIDSVVGMIFLVLVSGRFRRPHWYNSMIAFLGVIFFSFILSVGLFGFIPIIRGSFYLLRLVSYLFFFVALFNVIKGKIAKDTLFNSLIGISAIVGLFGWIQYFEFPDLRSLFYIGWDDHLYRLIGTFLDPGFTSIIICFGFILSLVKFLEKKKAGFLILSLFFLLTLAFTYARASYISLLLGVFVISNAVKSYFPVMITFLLLLILILFLPRPEGYGVKLERTHSIYAKIENYSQTISIIKKAPLFGVGFNNLCIARAEFLGDKDINSHSCSGSDSSTLFILATTGVIGAFAALKFFHDVVNAEFKKSAYSLAFFGCLAALILHSFFVNSLFYPWVMGYMAILAAIKESS